ncbi:MAG: hypothetical protein HY335_07810 [Deinococcus sp.]|nr:hypothetical protein [Deinococcus sp.]
MKYLVLLLCLAFPAVLAQRQEPDQQAEVRRQRARQLLAQNFEAEQQRAFRGQLLVESEGQQSTRDRFDVPPPERLELIQRNFLVEVVDQTEILGRAVTILRLTPLDPSSPSPTVRVWIEDETGNTLAVEYTNRAGEVQLRARFQNLEGAPQERSAEERRRPLDEQRRQRLQRLLGRLTIPPGFVLADASLVPVGDSLALTFTLSDGVGVINVGILRVRPLALPSEDLEGQEQHRRGRGLEVVVRGNVEPGALTAILDSFPFGNITFEDVLRALGDR